MIVKMKGNPLHLTGNPIKVSDKLNFIATNLDLTDFKLDCIKNKKKIISVVPSLDTSICLIQTETVNKQLSNLENYQLITISRDLPFASKRICESFKQENHLIISDYNYRDFGNKTNLAITELQLLTRAILILDENNVIEYIDINDEITNEPDYNKLKTFLKI